MCVLCIYKPKRQLGHPEVDFFKKISLQFNERNKRALGCFDHDASFLECLALFLTYL